MSKSLFIAGIGTEVGKTIASAIVAQSLKASYWKPVQCGDIDNSDTKKVNSLVSFPIRCFDSKYEFKTPSSPHLAASVENKTIDLNKLNIPKTDNVLLIEGAGGIQVPLNNKETFIQLLKKWNIPVLLVSRNYLGSINHTLLTIDVLKKNNITIGGILFMGLPNKSSEDYISEYSSCKFIIKIGEMNVINKYTIEQKAISSMSTLQKMAQKLKLI